MRRGLFITGTDTGVGKTIIAAAIIRALQAQGIKACGMKPIETGCCRVGSAVYPSDGMFLKKAAGMDDDIGDITPYCFETPAAPSLASEMEAKAISPAVIIEKFNRLLSIYTMGVVEGVGGLLVPIRKNYFVIDLIRELELPLIVVSRPTLGTLNHTLLTVNHALREGIRVSGIIINFSRPPDGTISEKTTPQMLESLSPAPIIGTFPYLDDPGSDLEKSASRYLDIEKILKEIERKD